MQSIFEKMGGTYRKEGDYYIPNLEISTESEYYHIGKYGRMHRRFLEEHHTAIFTHWIMNDTLCQRLVEVDKTCNEQMDILISAIAKSEGVTEKLKSADQMEWVGRMNNIHHRAEEIVLAEYVYQI